MTSLFRSGISKDSFYEQRKIAKSALEKLDSIKNIVKQRDELRRKLESSQSEFDALKREHEITCRGDSQCKDFLTKKNQTSCNLTDLKKLENLENGVKNLKSVEQSPEIEGIIKEIELLKEQYSKFSNLENENKDLKMKLELLQSPNKEDAKDVKQENGSINFNDPEKNYSVQEFKIYKYRSQLLDEILRDRDRLSKKLEEYSKIIEDYTYLKERHEHINDLEIRLEFALKEKLSVEEELELLKCKFLYSELELLNRKAQEDNLQSKISCLEQEKESFCDEIERLKDENESLRETVKNFHHLQNENEVMKDKMRNYEAIKTEREMFKSKYEKLISLECEVDILRAQLAKARVIENERDLLENKVENLVRNK